MTDPAFDYRAYAPLVPPKLLPPARPRPQLVCSQPTIPVPADELSQQLGRIRNCLVLIRQCAAEIGAILWRRWCRWCDTHIFRSLTSAWIIAALGWGGLLVGAASILILQHFIR